VKRTILLWGSAGTALLAFLAIVALPAFVGSGARPIVVFRYDDYSSCSPLALEQRIIDIFAENGVPVTFAVIPFVHQSRCGKQFLDAGTEYFALTEERAEILRGAIEGAVVNVALHGYSHQENIPVGGVTEFRGMSLAEQRDRIARGKAHLEGMLGVRVSTFVPPWNTYDLNTVQALEDMHFSCLSSSINPRRPAERVGSLAYLPASATLSRVRKAVAQARRLRGFDPIIVVLFHDFSFVELGKGKSTFGLQDLRSLLGWLKDQDDLRILPMEEAILASGDLGGRRVQLANSPLVGWHLGKWIGLRPRNVYVNATPLLRLLQVAATTSFCLVLAIFALAPTLSLLSRGTPGRRGMPAALIVGVVAMVLGGAAGAAGLVRLIPREIALYAMVACSGVVCGVLLAIRDMRRRGRGPHVEAESSDP